MTRGEAVRAYRNMQRLIIILVTRVRNGAAQSHEPLDFLQNPYFKEAWDDLRKPLRSAAKALERPSWKGEFRDKLRSEMTTSYQ